MTPSPKEATCDPRMKLSSGAVLKSPLERGFRGVIVGNGYDEIHNPFRWDDLAGLRRDRPALRKPLMLVAVEGAVSYLSPVDLRALWQEIFLWVMMRRSLE